MSKSETRLAPAQPIVCLYPADAAARARLHGKLPAEWTLFESASQDAAQALEQAARAHPGCDVLLLAARCELPDRAWPRLQLACAAQPDAEVWTPLCTDTPALDPRSSTAGRQDRASLDAWLWLLADRGYPQTDQCSALLSLWRGEILARCLATGTLPTPSNPLIQRLHLCDTLLVSRREHPLEPSASNAHWTHPAVAALRQRLAEVADATAEPIGLDERPVLLHVLHGWGGGAQRFVDDLITADRQHRHLVLVAVGSSQRRVHGELIELRTRPDGPSLRRWPLAAPASGTRLASAEYRGLLSSVCVDFRVAGVLISSLIGHSLDALRSGRPTAVVCHDYYPLWPLLHADFGDAGCRFNPEGMAAAIAAAGPGFEFAERDASHWQALRAAYMQAVAEADALLIAPSRCVQDNQCRIAPELAARRWRQISHGLAPWPQPLPEIAPDLQRAALRVVIPGRIRGGKGEHLLAALLPQLPVDVELILLGCGAAGMRFFGHPQVHVLLDYQRDQLPQRLALLRPDLALLPASVAETFSYMLSELRALGVPVVATALGSFIERIDHGQDGLLVAPQPAAIAELLHQLSDDCAPLAALRQRRPGRSIEAMAADYTEALALASPSSMPLASAPDGLLLNRLQQAECTLATTATRAAQLRVQLQRQDIELERRADWANREHRQAGERLLWITQLQAELAMIDAQRKALDEQLVHTERELEARSAWAHTLAESNNALHSALASADEQRRQLTQLNQEVGERLAALQREESRLHEHVAGLIAQRDQFEAERNRILVSLSWRITRPLRFLRRLIGGGVSRLRFRVSRLAALQRRAFSSLRVRGLAASWRRLRQELRPAQPTSALAIPDTPEASPVGPTVDDIELPRPRTPRASVIVPVYNQLAHTLTCLRALSNQTQRTAFEVIVVDDCSSDASAELLPQVRGLRYLRNRENLGFIGACNAGAAIAEGEYLVFLNNDTAVQAHWLDALIDTFSQRPDAGLVGAKLVYPDGRLQEAGGIVFRDGSGWNYGRFEDPADPRFGFLREADYCSGAAIALPAELFHSLGGFDSHYAPAYYEDTDLAMKVRAGGLAVLYQPASVVVHFEGVTSGTDTGSGVKAYQVVNQQKFLARWADTLASHNSPPPATPISVSRQQRARRRVLVIDATTPQPDQDSGSLRLVNLLRLLVEEGCAVTFFADNRAYVAGYTEALQQLGVEVLWHPWLSDPVAWFSEHGPQLHSVLVSRHYIACSYLDLARRHAPQARFIFDTVDLHYLREQRAAELEGRADLARSAAQTRQQELAVIARSDVTLVVSPVEQALLAVDAPGARVEVLSNVHEVFGCRRPFGERRDLMFIGGYQHPPNVDAACWFVGEVWPLIHAADPDLRFHLIGSKASDEVQALGNVAGVVFHGHVEDIEPFLDGCRLAVAPLRYGAGVKGKVNMSMSYGQPVVATPTAVEGMHLRPDQDVLVADSPAAFAQQVLRLYSDATLWQALSDNGTENVRRHFGFDAARAVIRRLLD